MVFSETKYPILKEVWDNNIKTNPEFEKSLNHLVSKNGNGVLDTIKIFKETVIKNCEKGYYLTRCIHEKIINDTALESKLNSLFFEIDTTKGFMLLPHSIFSEINAFGYYIQKNTDGTIQFSFSFYSMRGIEIFCSGLFYKKVADSKKVNIKCLSVVSSDIILNDPKINEFIQFLISYASTILVFMQFAEIETVITEGTESKGKRKQTFNDEKYLNNSKINIEIIDSKWFRHLIRIGAFKVNGHFRLQACGPGFSERKLLWINDFVKNGYNREPKKLKHEPA